MGVYEAASTGNRLITLQALRDALARALDDVDPRYAAPLAKQLADVMRELEDVTPAKESPVDELARARTARRAGAAGT